MTKQQVSCCRLPKVSYNKNMTKQEALQRAKVATAASIWDPEDEPKAKAARRLREQASQLDDDGSVTIQKPIPVW